MNSTTLNTLLAKAKTTLRITTTAFDDEITDIIQAGVEEMETRGVLAESRITSPMVIRALLTYVRMHFGEPEQPERLTASYHEQLAQLMTTTNYTEW